jgi:molecular chaperone GrpE
MSVSEASQNGSAPSPEATPQGGEAGIPAGAGNDAETLRKALAAAEEATRTQRDLYMRALAELDNIRKRAQRDIESAHRYALEGFVTELLPVRDGLEQAVRQGAQADAKTLISGQQATLKLLDRAFEKYSIQTLDKAGGKFDPALHEAVLMQPASGAEPGSVLQVVQTGYELKGRLLRPARVIVAKANDG